ncbi:MAG: ribulokinase [Phycisphaerae bacterium]|nr:ribulokinase [Phycisphaerae bacterium]
MARYTIGLDYGTNSVRAILVNVANGKEVASATWTYPHGKEGILLSDDPNLARQHPADYLKGAETTIKRALGVAKRSNQTFKPDQVIGLGVDTTGSTPLPVDRKGQPLAFDSRFEKDLDAMAWLWKDHTSIDEAIEITDLARKMRPQYLAKCGGIYSSEWFFSKILHCLRTNPKVFSAAYTWVEAADWIPAVLTGTEAPEDLKICVCAAGHKAMFNAEWGGYPDEKFLTRLDPKLGDLHTRLKTRAQAIDKPVGGLCKTWASKTGLREGIPVAAGVFDAHAGAVGSGIQPGMLVKILGTSTCDMMIVPADQRLADIPGLCGIVKGSIVPGFVGLEAGQSAVGDIFNWYVDYICPGGKRTGSHTALTNQAEKLAPGASGLLALDWNNGNRTVLVDPRLSGLLIGQSLHTTPAEIYRALIEATAFGALTIINRLEQYHVKVDRIVTGGGIAEKNPMVMQIYADVTNRPMMLSRSSQTCALGAAVAAAVCAGEYPDIPAAQEAMTGLKSKVYDPNPAAVEVYGKLYKLYRQLHDAFGTTAWKGSCFNVMKDLLAIRAEARGGAT